MQLFRYTWKTLARELVLIIAAVIFLVPLYVLITVSLKPSAKAYDSPLAFPRHPKFRSYSDAWSEAGRNGLGHALLVTIAITVCAVAAVIVLGSMAAFAIARRADRLSNALFVLFLLGIIVPFQLGVVPLYVAMRHLHLTSTLFGMVLLWTGLVMPLTVFLYTGFIRTLPREYEEAAMVDGASFVRTYVRVVFPLLYPVTGTVAILAGIFIWNDFFIPLIFLSGSDNETLTVAIYSFVGEYSTEWNKIFAGIGLSIAPVLAFYLFAQRQLIKGFSGGLRG
jgi:raffinose/stachyose/melibiose transport system permease protein